MTRNDDLLAMQLCASHFGKAVLLLVDEAATAKRACWTHAFLIDNCHCCTVQVDWRRSVVADSGLLLDVQPMLCVFVCCEVSDRHALVVMACGVNINKFITLRKCTNVPKGKCTRDSVQQCNVCAIWFCGALNRYENGQTKQNWNDTRATAPRPVQSLNLGVMNSSERSEKVKGRQMFNQQKEQVHK